VRVVLVVAAAAVLACAGAGFTSGNGVPASKLGSSARATGANDVKPAQCAALALTTVVSAAVSYTAPNGVNGLLLGSSVPDSITGRSGNECILGGGGNDVINGGSGTDVCIGGPGVDTFANCETQIQ
jgi:Ca2+-binding RTX toxin-like protein